MACPHKVLVVRSNYGDESIALIAALHENQGRTTAFEKIYVVSIDTGWAAAHWAERVQQGMQFAQSCGFEAIQLTARTTFSKLVLERQNFPTPKYQWCAGFLKGLPMLEWLDQHDAACEWLIALPKRQALYRSELPERITECPYHGERAVWHPNLKMTHEQRDKLITQVGFRILNTRSLECDPCVNSSLAERNGLTTADSEKLANLEQAIAKPMFTRSKSKNSTTKMDLFSMGCGDPFGCGL